MDDKNPVSWVLPPDAATAKDRDMDAEDGRQRKKAPTTLQNPYIEMFEDSIRKKNWNIFVRFYTYVNQENECNGA